MGSALAFRGSEQNVARPLTSTSSLDEITFDGVEPDHQRGGSALLVRDGRPAGTRGHVPTIALYKKFGEAVDPLTLAQYI